jgi:3-oxoacyl-[acyl-carrier-protein] synthase-1
MTSTGFARDRRLGSLADMALQEAVHQACGKNDPGVLGPTAILLGSSEPMRPGYKFPPANFHLARWASRFGLLSVGPSEVLNAGNCSGQVALNRAVQLLDSGTVRACIIGVADTQLQVRVIRWHEHAYRLKCTYMDDGLAPGEAACFLVVEQETRAVGRGAAILARIAATASERETATVFSDQPNTAKALTTAARTALRDAGVKADALQAVWCDLNGESYRAREWGFTEVRLGLQTHTELNHPADCHGDLGAASDTNLLGLAALAQATGWTAGQPVLVFSGSEIDGMRAATVITPPPRQKTPPLPQVTIALPRVAATIPDVEPLGTDEIDITQSDDPPREYFDWQMRQEYLDNLAALHYQRKSILLHPTIPWPRLREPEQRMLNHLDAVVAGGPTSIWAVASGLLDGEEGKAFAGALLLGILPSPANFAHLNEALKPKTSLLAGIEAGLRHAPPSKALVPQVEPWLDHENPAIRAMAASLLSYRRELEPRRIVPFIQSDDPQCRLAGVRAARPRRTQAAVPALERLLTDGNPEVVHEALLTLLCLGLKNAPDRCRQLVRIDAMPAARTTWLLALCGQLPDLFILMRAGKALADPVTLAAMGILGNVQAVDYLLQALDTKDDGLKVAAAEALELITAAGLRENATLVEKTELLPGEFVEESREVERIATSPSVWQAWWKQSGRRFDPKRRWRRGQPFDFGVLIAELKDPSARFHSRQRAYWELLILSGQSIAFEPDWFVPRQMEALAQWDSWWAANKPH